MKIAVVGSGAMGSLFGAMLAESGYKVWLFDIWDEHINTINKNGLIIKRQGHKHIVRINATTNYHSIGQADLVIIFVKSGQTAPASETAAKLAGSEGLVLTLQNGLGNADIIEKFFDADRILAGTTSHGATLLSPGCIHHAGLGPTFIGMWSGGEPNPAYRIANFFVKSGIDTQVIEDVRNVIWDKLLVNVGINAITALTGIKNGQILDMEVTRELCRAAIEEAVAVAQIHGIKVRDEAVKHVLQVARSTAANRSSMGQDIDNNRLTEIDAINGAVVSEAQKVGLETPVNKTLTALIETLQGHYP